MHPSLHGHLSTHRFISFMAHPVASAYSKCAGAGNTLWLADLTHSGALGYSQILVKIYKKHKTDEKHIPQLEEWPSNHKLLTLLGSCRSRTWLRQPTDLFLQTAPCAHAFFFPLTSSPPHPKEGKHDGKQTSTR